MFAQGWPPSAFLLYRVLSTNTLQALFSYINLVLYLFFDVCLVTRKQVRVF